MLELDGMLTLVQMRWVLSELLCAFCSTTGKRLTELPSLALFFLPKQGVGMSTEPPPEHGKKPSSINKFSIFTIFTSL